MSEWSEARRSQLEDEIARTNRKHWWLDQGICVVTDDTQILVSYQKWMFRIIKGTKGYKSFSEWRSLVNSSIEDTIEYVDEVLNYINPHPKGSLENAIHWALTCTGMKRKQILYWASVRFDTAPEAVQEVIDRLVPDVDPRWLHGRRIV